MLFKSSRFYYLSSKNLKKNTKKFKFRPPSTYTPPTHTHMVGDHLTPNSTHSYSFHTHIQYLHQAQVMALRTKSPWLSPVPWKKCWPCLWRRWEVHHQHHGQSVVVTTLTWSWSGSFEAASQLLQWWLCLSPVILLTNVPCAKESFPKHYAQA
jgi:hypothetical protein